MIHTDANDDSLTLSVHRTLAGHLTLQIDTLDFGETTTEQLLTLSNTGDDSLTWSVAGASIPYWVEMTPTGGNLAESAQTQITVRVDRTGINPGVTTAAILFLSDTNSDSLTVSVERSCSILGDNFNEGNAAGWDAIALDVSQHADGYVILDPNSAIEAGRLLQNVNPTVPYVLSAKLRRIEQTVSYNQYGLLLEDSTIDDALYFAVKVDDDTNYTLEQSVAGNWEILQAGFTALLSAQNENWNILRLEIYEDSGTIYARGYAGTSDEPLFESVELDSSLSVMNMGLRSDEYTIHADWFCVR